MQINKRLLKEGIGLVVLQFSRKEEKKHLTVSLWLRKDESTCLSHMCSHTRFYLRSRWHVSVYPTSVDTPNLEAGDILAQGQCSEKRQQRKASTERNMKTPISGLLLQAWRASYWITFVRENDQDKFICLFLITKWFEFWSFGTLLCETPVEQHSIAMCCHLT